MYKKVKVMKKNICTKTLLLICLALLTLTPKISNASIFASGSDDGTIRLWKWDTKIDKEIKKLTIKKQYSVESVFFSPDGEYLASGSQDNTIRIWDTSNDDPNNWALLKTLTGHDGPVNSVAFSPDGEYLASSSDDETIRIWDISNDDQNNWTLLKTLRGHTDFVNSVTFSQKPPFFFDVLILS